MSISEAKLEDVGSGLAPVTPGWFVVNTADAAWLRNDAFGGRCVFESTPRVLAELIDVARQLWDSWEDRGFVVDQAGHISHVVLERGHLWGRREVVIPIGAVERVETDEVVLTLSKDEVGALESHRVHRWRK